LWSEKTVCFAALAKAQKQFDAKRWQTNTRNTACKMNPFIQDTVRLLHNALDNNQTHTLRGGPREPARCRSRHLSFVTSSNSSTTGVWSAAASRPDIDRIIGVLKAYGTRVGRGPFPTELDDGSDGIGEKIRRIGREYGTVTGRPRRCGWFDAVAARYTARLSGATELNPAGLCSTPETTQQLQFGCAAAQS